jgi:hypothetical protein
MGYRSDVSVAFYSRDLENLPFAAVKLWFDENYPRKEATEEWGAVIETGNDFVLVTYQSVKWYPDYGHVQAVRRVLDTFCECFDANEPEALASFEVVEVGEEATDITETRSDYCDYRMGLTRTIEFA